MSTKVPLNCDPRYSIDREGNVYGIKTHLLSQHLEPSGYIRVSLASRHVSVHKLLAETFIPNPDNKPTVNHIDGNKSNNSLTNLEWATYPEQQDHANSLGLRHTYHSLTKEQVIDICTLSGRQAIIKYKVGPQVVRQIKNRELFADWTKDVEIKHYKFTAPGLTIEEVKDIRSSNLKGIELAQRYNTSPGNISRIRSGQRYREVK